MTESDLLFTKIILAATSMAEKSGEKQEANVRVWVKKEDPKATEIELERERLM